MVIGGNNVYFGTIGYSTKVLDWQTGKVRETTLGDYEETLKLIDVLDNVDIATTRFMLGKCLLI
jgi:trimethylamine:corrinoid methyltransferase-like protein